MLPSVLRLSGLLIAFVLIGCAKPQPTTVRVGEHSLRARSALETVKYAAEYGIEYTLPGQDEPVRVAGRQVLLVTGDHVGFVKGDDGKFVALLPYDQRMPLPEIPPEATSVAFVTQLVLTPRTYESQSSSYSTRTTVSERDPVKEELQRNDDEKALKEAQYNGFSNVKDYEKWKNRGKR